MSVIQPLEPDVQPVAKKIDGVHQSEHEYTIQAGDSMRKISKKFYNDARYWKQLAGYNKIPIKKRTVNHTDQFVVSIFPGNKLKIPSLNVLVMSDGYND